MTAQACIADSGLPVPAAVTGRRIGILLPDLRAGGAERVSISLAKGFAAAGYRPEFIMLAAQGEFLPEVEGRFAITVLAVRRYRQALFALVRHLRRDPPDALLVQMWPLSMIAPVAALLAGYRGRVVVAEHGSIPHRRRFDAALALGYRLRVTAVAVSGGLAAEFARRARLPVGRVHAVANPISRLSPPTASAEARAEAAWRGTPRGARILSVARLTEAKDLPMLLRAFARMPDRFRLMIVGSGEAEPHVRAEAERLGLSDRLILTGFQPDPAPFYRSADVFALSSCAEGFGNVLVEALSCGLPVVATDCPFGPAEILAGGRYGRLVPVGDDAAMAQALMAALAEPGDPAPRKARAAYYSVEAATARYLALLFAPAKRAGQV